MVHHVRKQTSATDMEPVRFIHTVSEARHLLPSASRWNSIEIDFNLIPQSSTANDSILSQYSKSLRIQSPGVYPNNSPVKFRASSGLHDGNMSRKLANLEGCFYDSGNNIKFSFPSYLDHVKDIIKWGSDYLLKLFGPPNTTSEFILQTFVKIGSGNIDAKVPNDIAKA
ncbi:hypothetical protein DVH24_009081 [Malus domestica]|uniref:Uncharacterized protein n=1 Tax=Malus domestica TaxID=3750 RepID=A0A498JNX7_MALDO|nr:hypothetical protein DVH24_009081 [Malus domestica]